MARGSTVPISDDVRNDRGLKGRDGATPFPVLVLGGYGEFGGRIARLLARDPAVGVIVAGRSLAKAEAMAARIRAEAPGTAVAALALDVRCDLAAALAKTGARLVIHCCGPFQGHDFAVAECCIAAGAHYIDIADGRDHVCGFDALDAAARSAGVLAVSGASSVPGLSSAVLARLRVGMASVDDVAIAIAPGSRAAVGAAVIATILGRLGQLFRCWRDRSWVDVHGWQDLHRRHIAGLGRRWLAACDVPDHDLLPARVQGLRSVRFHAGHELGPLHFMLWGLSWLRRFRLLPALDRFTPAFQLAARLAAPFGSDRGGMTVDVAGVDVQGAPVRRNWTIVAENGHGPWIPSLPAAILAGALARGRLPQRGAMPCWNLFDLERFANAVAGLEIRMTIDGAPFPARAQAAA